MSVEHVQDLVVRTMIQFSYHGLLAMLCGQILPVLLVAASQCLIYNGLDSHHSWFTIMEIPRSHELVLDLVSFGALQGNVPKLEASILRLTLRVRTPAWMSETKVLAPAVPSNPLWAAHRPHTQGVPVLPP